jgi:dolichol kinase
MSVFLTIADAIAAIIGSKYGKHQISAKNKKTY